MANIDWLAELMARDRDGILNTGGPVSLGEDSPELDGKIMRLAQTYVADAVSYLHTVVPGLDLRLSKGTLGRDFYVSTVCRAVFRALRASNGLRSDGRMLFNDNQPAQMTSDGVFFLQSELAALAPPKSTSMLMGSISRGGI